MKRLIMTILAVMTISIVIMAQERTVENRPYTDCAHSILALWLEPTSKI